MCYKHSNTKTAHFRVPLPAFYAEMGVWMRSSGDRGGKMNLAEMAREKRMIRIRYKSQQVHVHVKAVVEAHRL